MPIIVPIEENHVGLASATDATFRAPDYSGSGLEALGAGLVQLGGGGQQLVSGIEERRRRAAEAIAAAMLDDRHQSNIDDAAVKQAYVDYSDPTHEALHGEDGLFNQEGAAVHAAFPGLVEKLADNHDKALSKLDDVQRTAVAPAMNERLRSDVARAADYVRQQGAAEQKWQSEQLQKAAARDAVNHADDPELFDHHLATGEKTIRQQAKIDNVGDRLLDKQIADYRSGVHADTIEALAQRDPVQAADWYARDGDNLNRRDKQRVEAALDPAPADARAIVDLDAATPSEATNDALTLRARGNFRQGFATASPVSTLEASDMTVPRAMGAYASFSTLARDQEAGQPYLANASWAVDGTGFEPAAGEMSDGGESVSPTIARDDGRASRPRDGIVQRSSILSPGDLRIRANAMNVGDNALIRAPNLNVVLFGPGVSLIPVPVATFEEFDAAAKLASRLFDLDAVITGAQSGYLTGSLGLRGQSVIDGRVYGNSAPDRYYLATVVGGDGVGRLAFGKGDPPRTRVKAGFGGGIPLLIDGKDVPGYNAAWRRYDENSGTGKNIVAYNSKLNITAIFIQPHGASGNSLAAIREYIRKSGYNYALMFDGSGSTSLNYRGHQIISPDLVRQPLIVAGIGFRSK